MGSYERASCFDQGFRRAPSRLVIPSEIRRQLGIAPGDVLIAIVEDDRLVLKKREAVLQRRRRFAHIPAGPPTGSGSTLGYPSRSAP
ncbi:MAG: AbrB/MazE/SpoVT family DNA-binding domain-containing protein [Acidobacteria bacterium]|nr:AbrB/MazE/SpoVT family DNA-binding domain-containing protein [Acidobacteriota bacterium]